MKRCNSCKIDINTSRKYCPFCQDKLTGQGNSIYPEKNNSGRFKVFKFMIFISAIVAMTALFVDYELDKNITWSIYIILLLLNNNGGLLNNFKLCISL